MPYYTYILAKARNSTFYVGVTNDLIRRTFEHKEGLADGFTRKYGIKMLVYYEIHDDIDAAIQREKSIKRWTRASKMAAIEAQNPDWADLYNELVSPDPGVSLRENRDDTLKECQINLTRQLTATGIDAADLEARLLLQHALGCDAAALVRDGERVLSEAERTAIDALAVRRLGREPLSQILGYKDFWKDRFLVTRDVLTPRADSETLIEAMLAAKPQCEAPYRLLDVGTGSGCLLLSLLREYPSATGLGLDRSEAALGVARRNAAAVDLALRAFFACGNWMQTLQTRYDMIISNPPYIEQAAVAVLEPEVKDYEPHAALSGGDDGLEAYRQIVSSLPNHLAEDGVAVIELGAGQASAVSAIAEQHGLRVRDIRKDLAHIARAMVIAR